MKHPPPPKKKKLPSFYKLSLFSMAVSVHRNRPFAQSWPGNEFWGIAGENRLRCVCFSFEISYFLLWKCRSTITVVVQRSLLLSNDHCCVPRCSNRSRSSPSLSSHSFPLSSELRKCWIVAIRLAKGSNFCVPNSTLECSEHVLPTDFHIYACA